ncbi:hypothetical protein WJX74_008969 [Apatococcus lobatus]|uniref:Molybdenum cofactor sulfurase n=1 Tax=Apatococcus lobatus TaxID=904363 RepID=A0AAW1QN19_9CHLO
MCRASAQDYKVIFTSGVTGASKLVGEIMPWEAASNLAFTQDNHNSVLGHNLAHAAGASSMAVTIRSPLETMAGKAQQFWLDRSPSRASRGAFGARGLPRHALRVHFQRRAQRLQKCPGISTGEASGKQQHWYVLLDAAKACASKPPDLSTCPTNLLAI